MTDAPNNKRKRPSSPEEDSVPMADGVVMHGFLRGSKRTVLEFHGQKTKIEDDANSILEDVHWHLRESGVVLGGGEDFKQGIQMVNSLLEIVASITILVQTDDDEERRKLAVLHEHAVEGLQMIGAEEEEESDDE